eukprot:363605-Chlamydomonas_euryale.AAC.4
MVFVGDKGKSSRLRRIENMRAGCCGLAKEVGIVALHAGFPTHQKRCACRGQQVTTWRELQLINIGQVIC